MNIIQHNNLLPLNAFIDEALQSHENSSGLARIKKNYLRSITDEAFVLSVRAALHDTDIVHIFFVDNQRIYIAWKSQKKSTAKQLRALIGTALVPPGSKVQPAVITSFIDLMEHGEKIKNAARTGDQMVDHIFEQNQLAILTEDPDSSEETDSDNGGAKPVLTTTPAQVEHYNQMRGEKRYRKQLHMLVVEDQVFSQKLMCDVLRSARAHNNNETPLVDAVEGIQEAWKIYLKKAPDLTFVDLGLVDGSGHTLARAMKELDPSACVIIVTANNYEEELSVAKQNNVDGFIGKPYNKKQIFDFIERYVESLKSHGKGGSRGFTGQFR